MQHARHQLNSMNRLGRDAAFTLIEILIAIGILVVALTGVIALYAVAVDAHRAATEQSGAAALAESMLSSITADFAPRLVDDDNKATFLESYIDLCTKYREVGELEGQQEHPFYPERGIEAPNAPGFNVEVSIYPLPRRLWTVPEIVSSQAPHSEQLKEFDPGFRKRVLDTAIGQRTWEEFQWDAFMCSFYDVKTRKIVPGADTDRTLLTDILAQALEYKVVVKTIRGNGEKKRVDIFETIITPRGIADKQVP